MHSPPWHSERRIRLGIAASALAGLVWAWCVPLGRADDWMTWPSSYTHDPTLGVRVDQFNPPVQPAAPQRADYSRGGYRHYRSTLQTGQSMDSLHVVDQWGPPVMPYEQWRFPFRPYGVPYDAWGPQMPYGMSFFNGYGGAPGYPLGGFGGGFAPGGYPSPGQRFPPGAIPLTPEYGNEPWYDGTYPDVPPLRMPGGDGRGSHGWRPR